MHGLWPSLMLCVVVVFADELSVSNRDTQYLVLAPRIVRPGTIYNLVVMILEDIPSSLTVFASLSKDGEEITGGTIEIVPRFLQTLPLQVPTSVVDGNYALRVEGRKGGDIIFLNTTSLEFTPRFLSIVVQTSRPIYRAGQEVRFRVLVLHTDLQPFDDGLEVYIIDPDGFIMRRWVSAYTNHGVSSLKFKLPKMAKDGYWKIRIKAWGQVEEQKIKVETYFSPLFEMHVKWPPYIVDTEESITAQISGLYTTEKIAQGNLSLTLSGRKWRLNETFRTLWTDKAFIKNKEFELNIDMSRVASLMGSAEGVELRLEVTMTDFMSGETVQGFSHTRIFASALKLSFLSSNPAVFKPGLPFNGQVSISYEDKERVPSESLAKSKLLIQVTFELDTGTRISLPDIVAGTGHQSYWNYNENIIDTGYMNQIFVDQLSQEKYINEGVLSFQFDTPNNTQNIKLRATYTGEDGMSVETSLVAVQFFSPNGKYLNVWTSTVEAQCDEYAVFHVKYNVPMDSFQYLIISKNQILTVGEQQIQSVSASTTTFSVPLAANMAPGFSILVFHVTQQGEVLADTCFLPVNAFKRYITELEINTGKDFKAERVEVRASGDEGAFIAINTLRSSSYLIQAGNELTESRVTDSLMAFENYTRSVHKVSWKSRDGTIPEQSMYFTSMNYGLDVNKTFSYSGLIVFTALDITTSPNSDICNSNNELPCATKGCYKIEKHCDGIYDCSDGFDESHCLIREENDYDYKISRTSRSTYLYDADDGDWGWREIKNNDHVGIEFEPLDAPKVADDWYFTAFSVSKKLGFSIIPEPFLFSTKRPFVMHVSGPSVCHHGEQVGLRLTLLNNDKSEALVLVQLIGSDDYKFVHVEMDGIVSSYSARLTSGDHQVLVYLAPETQEHIDFPIAPTVQGEIEVMIVGSTQSGRSICKHSLKVHSEGGLINKHTSVFLDLKSRALVLSYLDIIVEESPIVPYQEWRRYALGSPKGSIMLTGDIIGPVFASTPITTDSTLKRSAKGTDARVFELAANIWTLHYLRLTNQLHPPKLKEVLEECNAIMANIMRRYNATGWFCNWDTSEPSVWLTAWALRVFKHATFPDWEFQLYIDPEVFRRSVIWLLKYQTHNGSFIETPAYSTPFDSKFNTNNSDIALTALVVVTLSETLELMTGSVRTASAIAIQKAAKYLEKSLNSLIDAYQLSITTYALTLAVNSEMEFAYTLLYQKRKQNNDGLIYWSTENIPTNPIKVENQRPFVRPRVYHESDSLAVEATSWALLVVLHREGVTNTTEKIVQWLTSVRMTSSGFISTVDTVVALQAMTEYAFRARLLDITDISVAIEMSSVGNVKHKMHIGNSSFEQPEQIEIPKVWGHVNVVAKGAGQAIVQMDVSYGIDYEVLREVPTYSAFSLNITEYYSTFRNKSAITIQSCFRWVREWPVSSSAAVLEMEIPTGYHLLETEAEMIAKSGVHPTLRDGRTVEGKTIWFFDRIEKDWTCFNHTVKRWYPVANMTKYRQAILYESTARERFVQVLFNSTPLYVLNICEVCGSYQCPYCPYYNDATYLYPFSLLPFCIYLMFYNLI